MEIKIEHLTEQNINEVYDISNEQFGKESWTISQFKECLNNKNYMSFVATKNNKVTSFLIAQNLIDSINLLLIATKNQFKKLGLASVLINELQKFSQKNNLKIWLEVKESNTPAINLYKKFGFNVLYLRKNYYKDGSSAIVMEKF